MKRVPDFLCRNIRGAIGKLYVIKHYKGGRVVKTRFPDMKRIVASEKQRNRRDLFRKAVVYAKWVIANQGRKEAFRRRLPRQKQRNVYQAALQMYMKGDQLSMVNCQLAKSERKLAMSNRQLAIDNKQRGMKGVKGQTSNVKGVDGQWSMVNAYREKGPWRVIWQKREDGFGKGVKDLTGFGNLLGLELSDGYYIRGCG